MNASMPVRALYARLQTAQPWPQAAPLIEDALLRWPHGHCMGVFMGLFGLSNRELLVMLSVSHAGIPGSLADPQASPASPADTVDLWRAALMDALPSDVRILELLPLRATVRPLTDAPFDRAGVHVFRWFTLPRSRMKEAVALSSAGWETFERDDDPAAGEGYRTEPLGLFAQDGPAWLSREGGFLPEGPGVSAGTDPGRPEQLLLLTWYDSMTSWERSRAPHPQATAHFRQRAALTSSIVAYATRLARTA